MPLFCAAPTFLHGQRLSSIKARGESVIGDKRERCLFYCFKRTLDVTTDVLVSFTRWNMRVCKDRLLVVIDSGGEYITLSLPVELNDNSTYFITIMFDPIPQFHSALS